MQLFICVLIIAKSEVGVWVNRTTFTPMDIVRMIAVLSRFLFKTEQCLSMSKAFAFREKCLPALFPIASHILSKMTKMQKSQHGLVLPQLCHFKLQLKRCMFDPTRGKLEDSLKTFFLTWSPIQIWDFLYQWSEVVQNFWRGILPLC